MNMEEVEDPEEAREASVLCLSENQDAKKRDEEPITEACERFKDTQGERSRLTSLQRDLTTLVTNIQTAADAKELIRRTELEEARRIRLERLENNAKFSQELFEEFTREWSIAKQKVIPQELQEALNNQEQLCAAIIEDKRKLIHELQQELKARDDRYVQDLRKQAEELDVMMERMDDQIKTLTKAYREELAQMERVYLQENEILLTRGKTEWEQKLKELWDTELERLAQRRKSVEEYEERVHTLMLETIDKYSPIHSASNSAELLHVQSNPLASVTAKLQLKKLRDENAVLNFSLTHMKSRICSLQSVMEKLKAKCSSQTKQFAKKTLHLSKEHERSIQQRKKINHFARTSAKQFEDMWLMIEGEVKELVERVLIIDSRICKQQLGIAWERPLMEFCGPIQPQKLGLQVQSEGNTEVEEGELSMETLKREVELLGDEVNVCTKESESINKAEKVNSKSATHLMSELIHPKRVEPSLKGFRQQHKKSREHSAHQHHSVPVAARDNSQDKTYWHSMANIISDDKIKLWDAAGDALKQYQVVLTDICELIPETQSLKQQNAELRMLLQQSVNSGVDPEVEKL